MSTPDRAEERAQEVAAGLERVRERIARACAGVGREQRDVTLVAVTKFFPASDVVTLARLGVTDVGENRHQEAAAKVPDVAAALEAGGAGVHPPRWHFIGGLQSNKAAAVAAYADVVESVDREKLLRGLSRGAHESGRVLDVLVQVSLDPPGHDDGRAGVAPQHAERLADAVALTDGLRLCGVMGVAPPDGDPAEAFDRLVQVAQHVRRSHPRATWLSAGMSADLEQAVAAGATHVRVGSAVLGPRPVIK